MDDAFGIRTWFHAGYLHHLIWDSEQIVGVMSCCEVFQKEHFLGYCISCVWVPNTLKATEASELVSCHSTHKARVGRKISKCIHWISRRLMPGIRQREANAWKYVF